MPPAFTVNGLASALGIDRKLIYAAVSEGALVAYGIGVKNFILTGSATDEPGTGTIIAWIKSHKR